MFILRYKHTVRNQSPYHSP